MHPALDRINPILRRIEQVTPDTEIELPTTILRNCVGFLLETHRDPIILIADGLRGFPESQNLHPTDIVCSCNLPFGDYNNRILEWNWNLDTKQTLTLTLTLKDISEMAILSLTNTARQLPGNSYWAGCHVATLIGSANHTYYTGLI